MITIGVFKMHWWEWALIGFVLGVVLFFVYFVTVQNCALTAPDLFTVGGRICGWLTYSAPEWVLPR